MKIIQLSVYIQNKPGRLSAIIDTLSASGIDIRALSIADTTEYGVLRMIVSDPQKAYQALKDAGFTVSTTKVLGVNMPDAPGGLSAVLEVLQQYEINVEYMYTFTGRKNNLASIVFKVENVEEAIAKLGGTGISLMSTDEAYRG